MEHCSSDLLSLTKAYPTALIIFSKNRNSFIARMSARFGDLALPSMVRAARLRYISQEPDFQILSINEIEAKTKEVFNLTENTSFGGTEATLPNLSVYSLSALCIMWGLGEDAKMITDTYSQQALAQMAKMPDTKFYVPRQSTELTRDEHRRFMTAAFVFESYCLTFFVGERLLFRMDVGFRESLFQGPCHENAVERFYCIMYHILQKHRELLSDVTKHLEFVHRIWPPSNLRDPRSDQSALEHYFLWIIETDSQGLIFNYIHSLASQGLNALVALQRMSIEELTAFTLATFLPFKYQLRLEQRLAVSITVGSQTIQLGTQDAYAWLPWAYLDSIFDDEREDRDGEEIWEDTWSRALSFWDPSEDTDPHGREDVTP